MRWLLLFWCAVASAQLPVVQLPQLNAPNAATPSTITSNQFRWWVASDVPLTASISNQWLDRIVSSATAQTTAVNQPTNSTKGVRFNGNQWLTYSISPASGFPPNFGNTLGWLAVLFNSDSPSGSPSVKAIVSTSSGYGIHIDTSSRMEYVGNYTGGPNVVGGAVATSTNIDILINFTTTNTVWYTNGVLYKTVATSPGPDYIPGMAYFGSSGAPSFEGPWKGYLVEFFAATNELASATQISKMHTYFTSTYGYSP